MKLVLEERVKFYANLCVVVGFTFGSIILANESIAVEFGEAVAGQTVKDRDRPEVDPDGVRLGNMLFYPIVTVTGEFNDNIFAIDGSIANEISDEILIIEPAFILTSNWSRHKLVIFGRAEIGRFNDITSEDYEDFDFGFNGRIDIKHWTNIKTGVRFQRLHEERGTPSAVSGLTPTVYDVLTGEAELNHTQNRVSFSLRGEVKDLDYDNVLGSGGVIFNNDDRDRTIYQAGAEIGYDLSSGVRAFIEGRYNVQVYNAAIDDNGFNRDSDGFAVIGGLHIELTGKLSAKGSIGYRDQRYDDASLVNINGVVWSLDVIWLPTGLTTVTVFSKRTIEETTLIGSSGYLLSRFGGQIDHEFIRNLIGSVFLEFQTWDYQGITREDNYLRTGVEVIYMLNRYLYASVRFNFVDRDSNVLGQDYKRNIVAFSLRGAF